MQPADTIVAVASPPGRSARAVVRVSGPGTGAIVARCTGTGELRRGVAGGHVNLGGVSVPALVLCFPGPRSYTGEDSAEIQFPGNPALVSRVIAGLVEMPGVRPAHPGEFSARAYLAGRLSLEQAEGVAAVIAAQSAAQLAAARELLSGRSGAAYRAMAQELTTLAALVEAGIDFTDQEDVRAISQEELSRRVGLMRGSLDRHLGPAPAAGSASGLPRVAMVGEPNAGKSTLFNALLGRARSVESPVAGTTRDVIAERLDLSRDLPGAGEVELLDLAGIDPSAAGGTDRAAQSAAQRAAGAAEIVLHCDPSGAFAPLSVPGKVLRVRTKADIPASRTAPGSIQVCALDGWHLPLLRRAIADAAWGSLSDAPAMAAPRHARALAATRAALEPPADMNRPEVVAATLRAALDALGELTGRVSPDDVLGRVFAAFCIGK